MALVLSWNVAGRVALLEDQVSVVLGRDWDVVCLQEVTPRTAQRWAEALTGAGYAVELSGWPVEPRGPRRLAVLTAAKGTLRPVAAPELPWPERHLACDLALDGIPVEVRNVHAPLSQKADRVKVRTLEAVFAAVARDDGVPRIVAGDFNTPRYESRTGEVLTFARTRSGRLRTTYGERHDRAELALVVELPARGWRDAFRSLHGYERRDRSWVSRVGYGWRLDHLIVSPQLEPVACEYLHEWREHGLSDHSAIWADVRRSPATPAAGGGAAASVQPAAQP
jgi:endonuclease/exonuclease/phosphatase family metal-dependent hydrolase